MTDKFNPEFIREQLALAEKATPRPFTAGIHIAETIDEAAEYYRKCLEWRKEVTTVQLIFKEPVDDPLMIAIVGNGPNGENNADYMTVACNTYPLALAEIERLQAEVERLKAESEWIPVGERLPEAQVDVWVLWHWDSQPDKLWPGVTFLQPDENSLIMLDGDYDKQIEYWKPIDPLPAAPRSEK